MRRILQSFFNGYHVVLLQRQFLSTNASPLKRKQEFDCPKAHGGNKGDTWLTSPETRSALPTQEDSCRLRLRRVALASVLAGRWANTWLNGNV